MVELLDRIDDITPQWLAAALGLVGPNEAATDGLNQRPNDHSKNTRIDSLSVSPVGTGQMADSFRVDLQAGEGVPSSVIIKMQAADELARQAGAGSAYRSEVGFYVDLAPTVAIRTPKCFCAVGPDDQSRFVLVLEDMAPAQQGDQLAGCTPAAASQAVSNLAGLHGPRWCDASLLDLPWLRRASSVDAEFFQTTLSDRTEIFVEHYKDRISVEDREILLAFAPRSGAWLLARNTPYTLVHGDYRLDNLLFGAPGQVPAVAAVDWQTLEVGNPGRDLAYFLGNSLMPAERRAHEQALIATYHDALMTHGVTDYSLESCLADYRFGQFQGPFITVLAAASLTHTPRGDEMFVAMCTRACEAIRDLDSMQMLPG